MKERRMGGTAPAYGCGPSAEDVQAPAQLG
jgi:hypothetical protein